jgi:hypothetical protein
MPIFHPDWVNVRINRNSLAYEDTMFLDYLIPRWKMHDEMGTMMTGMQKMNGGMMGGGMMQGKKTPQSAPAPVKPEDHAAHHPE